ncbi:amidase [Microbacterium faecale]|uniref:Amidase n=1 Tax=Microbacterium faecale TaxID=1804630 RepID=A0A917DJT1_9MICO|nr:amidase [Microbacterium faecale]GGD43299.1 amidase [Microbacterium faecale]
MTPFADAHPADLTISEARAALRAGALTAVDLLEALLRRIEQRNGGDPSFDGAPDAVNAWARLYPERAFESAQAADKRIAEGDWAPLLGIPLAVKDIIGVAGLPLTASSRQLEGSLADSSSAAWTALERAGAVLVGHTHTHEFAAGGTTDQVGNPWNTAHSAGGSSGGSGAAVAAGMVPGALGTDTAGSVRVPASLSGVSAFKGSYGRVSLDGVIPLAATLDHVGPIARTIADCAVMFGALTNARGATDPWGISTPRDMDEPDAVPARLDGITIAVTDRTDSVDVDADVRQGLARATDALHSLGARILTLPAPYELDHSHYDTVLIAEARAYHTRFATTPERYRDSTRHFIAPGSTPLSADAYIAAQSARIHATELWSAWFREHNVSAVLEPTTAAPAPLRGTGYDVTEKIGGDDPLTCFTALWNFVGFPAAALPSGLSQAGLPTSVSLIGPPQADASVLSIAAALQTVLKPLVLDRPA